MNNTEHAERTHDRYATRRAANIGSIVLAFFLCLTLFLDTLVVITRLGFLSSKGVSSMLNDSFYSSMLGYIEDQATYYTMPTGIDTGVVKNVVTDGDIKRDVAGHINAAFNGVTYTPKIDGISERLRKNINDRFKVDGVDTNTSEVKDIVNSYVGEILNIYTETVKVPGLDALAKVYKIMSKYSLIAILALSVFALVLVVVIVKSHHFPHRGMRHVDYALGGTGLMLLVGPAIIYLTHAYEGLNVSPEYFYLMCISFVDFFLRACMVAGAVFIVLAILLVFVIKHKRNHLKVRHDRF